MSKKSLKKHLQFKPEVKKIFDELDLFRDFCREFGYPFDETYLNNNNSSYVDFQRWRDGKIPRDNWIQMIKQVRKHA
jgi:hypothetical protein